MALVSSGQLSMGTIADNKDSASRANLSLSSLSQQFAVGSLVGDVDGSGAGNQTADRNLLAATPYAISEFYDAEYVNEFYDTVVAQLADGTAVTDDGYVDGESGRISFDVNDATLGNSYTAGLKLASDNSVVVSATETETGVGTKTIAFTAPSRDAASNIYYPFVSTGTYENAVGSNIDHYDAIGAVSIDAVSTTTVANTSTDTNITHGRSIADVSSLNDYNWSFVKTAGDGSGVSDGEGSYGTVTSPTSEPTITYRGPGTFTADLRVDGLPSQARNSTTAAQISHRIDYAKAITINNPSSLNEASTITATVAHQGFSSGIDVDLIQASDNSVLLSNDHGTDSRIVAVSNQNQTFTAPAQTATTLSVKVKGFDGSTSATSNAFNIYPLVSQELASGDISVSVDPVIVGANTVLSVANITDNIVGYKWAMTTGAGAMTSNNVQGGDYDGTSVDGTTVIDETSAATNTVSFNSAQSSKTITLTLYGKLSQTATATKTLSVELLDATTISAISNVNAGTAVTVAGNQSGLSGGVTFGLVDTGATTSFLSGKSTSDTTDSRYTLDAYTANFTAADSNSTLTLQGRVIDRSDATTGQNRNTSTFTVYPLLTTSKNTIYPSRNTIYSSTRASDTSTYPPTVSYQTPQTATDNVTGYLYSAGTSLTGHGFSAATSATTTYGGGSGVGSSTTSLRIQGSGASGTQTTTTTHAVTVNYEPRIYDITFTAGTIITETTDLYIKSITWQGFTSAGFIARVYTSSGGGGTEVGENEPAINDLGGITFQANCLDNNTGGAQTGSAWIHANAANIGTIDAVGTVYLRVDDASGTYAYEEQLTISDYTTLSITGYTVEGANTGFDDQEDAAVGVPPGDADPYTRSVYYVGTTLGTNTVTVLSSKGGSAFNGGNKWWDLPGGYIGYVESDGEITAANYIADAQAQPKAPTGVSAGSATTSTLTVSWTNASAIDDEIWIYYVKNGSNSADSGDTSWGDNPLSNSTTSDIITGLDAGSAYSFVVYAKNGSTLSAVGSGNRDTESTTAAAYWSSVFANFTMEGVPLATVTAEKTLVLNSGSGTTRVQRTTTSGIVFAYKTSSGASYSAYTTDVTFSFTSGTLYIKFYKSLPKLGSASDTFRFTNAGVDVDRVVTYEVADEP